MDISRDAYSSSPLWLSMQHRSSGKANITSFLTTIFLKVSVTVCQVCSVLNKPGNHHSAGADGVRLCSCSLTPTGASQLPAAKQMCRAWAHGHIANAVWAGRGYEGNQAFSDHISNRSILGTPTLSTPLSTIVRDDHYKVQPHF